jgi:hypothetical protein
MLPWEPVVTDPRQTLIAEFLAAQAAAGPVPDQAVQRRALDALAAAGFVVASLQSGPRPALRLLGDSAQLELTGAQLLVLGRRILRGEHEPWADLLLFDSATSGPARPPGRQACVSD